MRLVTKVALVLAAVITLSVALNYAVLKTTVLPVFVQLERDNANQNMQRVLDAIDGDLNYIRLILHDWGYWDDSYEFGFDEPAGAQAEYIEANLKVDSLLGLDMDIMYFFDPSGALIWGMTADPEAGEEIPADRILPPNIFAAESPLFDFDPAEPTSTISGILPTAGAPLLIASTRILTTEEGGPPAGTMIIGRVLDDAMIAALRRQTHVQFDLDPLERHDYDTAELEAMGGFGAEGQFHIVEEESVTHTIGVLRDVTDEPIMLLHVTTPRDIVAIGMKSTRIALLSLLAAGLVTMLVIGALLERVVLRPIGHLTEHVLAIKRSGDLSRRQPMRRDDEIGILSSEFDRMLGQLDSARKELVDQSYKAGIAEMAAGVLHNIRNQLSPMTMRIGRLRTLLGSFAEGNADQAVDELAADEKLSKRSVKLVQYLKLSVGQAAQGGGKAVEELDAMSRQLARVEEVLGEQDRFSRAKRVIEPVLLSEIVDRAASLMPDAENSGLEIVIDPGVEAVAAFRADRFVLTQIVNNLLINSAEAIRAGGGDDGRIDIVAATRRSSDGGEEIALEIRDNGIGIGTEAMPLIFERGFTTKGGGKGGFGLHWCANTVATLSGRIHAESRGDGLGASMHVVLPTKTALESAA